MISIKQWLRKGCLQIAAILWNLNMLEDNITDAHIAMFVELQSASLNNVLHSGVE